MKYHVVLNACDGDIKVSAAELRGFGALLENTCSPGETFILCRKETEREALEQFAEEAVTETVRFLFLEYYQPEAALKALMQVLHTEDIYLFPGNHAGNELAVRLGARSEGSSLIGVEHIDMQAGRIVAEKLLYSSHMRGKFILEAMPCCLAITKGSRQKRGQNGQLRFEKPVEICEGEKEYLEKRPVLQKKEKQNGLGQAELLVVAGRGIGKKSEVQVLKRFAEKLKGELGITRPAAMSAFAPMDRMVGVSGTLCKPKICITAGVSGAAAFYAGIEKSDWIVAVNTDPEAPIMKQADIVIADDYRMIIKELEACMEREEQNGKTVDLSNGGKIQRLSDG